MLRRLKENKVGDWKSKIPPGAAQALPVQGPAQAAGPGDATESRGTVLALSKVVGGGK